jgi:hypothetical protein
MFRLICSGVVMRFETTPNPNAIKCVLAVPRAGGIVSAGRAEEAGGDMQALRCWRSGGDAGADAHGVCDGEQGARGGLGAIKRGVKQVLGG